MNLVKVYVDNPNPNLAREFTYQVDDTMYELLKVGTNVLVDFNHRKVSAYVMKKWRDEHAQFSYEVKYISGIVKENKLDDKQLFLLEQIMNKYVVSFQTALNVVYPKRVRNAKISKKGILENKTKQVLVYRYNEDLENKYPELKKIFLNKEIYSKKDLLAIDGISEYKIKKACELEILIKEYTSTANIEQDYELAKISTLNAEQEEAYKQIRHSHKKQFLLHGVTGSGKTEVFSHLVKDCIAANKQVLILEPEIILAEQIFKRFDLSYPKQVILLGASVTTMQDKDEYERIKSGQAKIVIGTRKSVFAPFKDLGLVVVDEEHSDLYKNNQKPMYHVLDIIEIYRNLFNFKLVLASATPSIETMARASSGLMELVSLPNKYVNSQISLKFDSLSDYELIFTNDTLFKMREILNSGEKVLIMHSQKAYSASLECQECLKVPKCPHCKVPLAYYQNRQVLHCNYCNFDIKFTNHCSTCQKNDTYKPIGVGLEKVHEYLSRVFSDFPIHLIDGETKKTKRRQILTDFKKAGPQILLGTQVVNQGLDFSNVALVVVSNIDKLLFMNDLRANEAVYQTVKQISGRAARNEDLGHVIVQTKHPEHQLFKNILFADYETFFNEELANRKILKTVPYINLARIELQHQNRLVIENRLKIIRQHLIELGLEVSEVKQPYVAQYRQNNTIIHRRQILIRYKREVISDLIRNDLEQTIAQGIDLIFDPKIIKGLE